MEEARGVLAIFPAVFFLSIGWERFASAAAGTVFGLIAS